MTNQTAEEPVSSVTKLIPVQGLNKLWGLKHKKSNRSIVPQVYRSIVADGDNWKVVCTGGCEFILTHEMILNSLPKNSKKEGL